MRELDRGELIALDKPRQPGDLKQIRDSHRWVLRLLSLGMGVTEVAKATGYSISRVSYLQSAPASQECIAQFRAEHAEMAKEDAGDYISLMTANALKAERQIADKLDEADESGETLPVRELIAISRDGADRIGYGKRQTNVNVNVDLADRLRNALQRSAKVIEARPVAASLAPGLVGHQRPQPSLVPQSSSQAYTAPGQDGAAEDRMSTPRPQTPRRI